VTSRNFHAVYFQIIIKVLWFMNFYRNCCHWRLWFSIIKECARVVNACTGCLKKVALPPKKTFWNMFTSVKSFWVKFCKFVGNSYPLTLICTNVCRFIFVFHQMALIFSRVPIVFTVWSFEYSPVKWKCRGRSLTAWFTQNSWASVVDSTADFHNSAQLPPFVGVTGNDWFCTTSLLTKRLHAQFVAVIQFSQA